MTAGVLGRVRMVLRQAMNDPFPPARIAGLMGLGATQQYLPAKDCATRLLPALAPLTLDQDPKLREQGVSPSTSLSKALMCF